MPETKNTAARFVSAFNAHDEAAIHSIHAPHVKFDAPGGFKANNSKDATAFAMRWLNAYPQGKMTVRSEIVSSPWIIQEIVMEGVHAGTLETPMGTVKPTHKKFVGYGVQIFKVEDGKITESRLYYDQLEMATQLGLIPAPAVV
jgi:limonene-1,2-epoxide hydrolase